MPVPASSIIFLNIDKTGEPKKPKAVPTGSDFSSSVSLEVSPNKLENQSPTPEKGLLLFLIAFSLARASTAAAFFAAALASALT